jgi:hypothetical protein
MKNRLHTAILLVSALIFSSCATMSYDFDYSKDFNFSTLKVYTIYPSTALKNNSSLLAGAISAEIDSAMQAKGYKRGNEVHDFVVTFYTETEIETSYGSVSFERWKGFWSMKEEPLFAVNGLIIIDIIDGNTGDVVWRGWDNQFFGKEENPKVILRETITNIMKQFPPMK